MASRILTQEDASHEIEVGVGEIIRIDLRYHSGSGFNWYPDLPVGNTIELIDNRSIDLSEPEMVGGPVLGLWYFRVHTPGQSELLMLLYRPWEGKSKATRKISFKIRSINR